MAVRVRASHSRMPRDFAVLGPKVTIWKKLPLDYLGLEAADILYLVVCSEHLRIGNHVFEVNVIDLGACTLCNLH